jgi:cyclopropane-fatty-acyl-phospholipid synthase
LGPDSAVEIVLADGTPLYRGSKAAAGRVVLRDTSVLRTIAVPPSDVAAGKAYIEGGIEAEGDVESVFTALEVALDRLSPLDWARAMPMLLQLPAPRPAGEALAHDGPARPAATLTGRLHSRARDRAAIAYHYDLPPAFFGLWLDPEMTYSCAYFRTPEDSLATAQRNKYDHIARKLGLRAGERILDIGCGWGGFIRFCAREYGARAVGVTLSEKQARYAQERIEREGLADRCTVELRDYRDMAPLGTFDKAASIGMFEHVGARGMNAYFRAAYRALRPGGLFLNHGISWQMRRPGSVREAVEKALAFRSSFMHRYVFPDGELLHVDDALHAAEAADFEVRDVENLREHYARTLRAWVERLNANADEARRLAGEAVVRTWRLYMAASARGFEVGRMGLVQMLLAKLDADGRADVPPTRAALYASGS